MTYVKQTWSDYDPAYPLSAERMSHIEDGISNATTSDSDLVLTSDTNDVGTGDVVFRTGTTARLTIKTSTGVIYYGDPSELTAITPALRYDAPNEKLYAKGLLLGDTGDTPDLAGRSANDGGAALNDDDPIWNIYSQAWDGAQFAPPTTPQQRNTDIQARARGDQTPTNKGGALIFATTPEGSTSCQEAFRVEDDGSLELLRGNGQRFRADLDSSLPNRLLFETVGTNAATQVGAAPSGSGTVAELAVYSAADGANCNYLRLRTDGTTAVLDSNHTGSGTDLPLSLQFSGSELMRMNGTGIGFYGATPVARQLLATGASHTIDDLITKLQALGLLRQS